MLYVDNRRLAEGSLSRRGLSAYRVAAGCPEADAEGGPATGQELKATGTQWAGPVIFAGNIEWRAAMAGSVNKVILVGNLGKDPFVLIVEDDPAFATILLDLVHDAGLKGVISPTGSGSAALARKLQPAAITLDLGLSDIDGFVLLDLLRHEPETRGIPVFVVSGGERAADALALGATEWGPPPRLRIGWPEVDPTAD